MFRHYLYSAATSATKKQAKQFVFGLLNRFSVDVKDGFNLFEQKLYINVSYINRANNGNSANSDLFMISAAFVQGVWTPPGKAILTEQISQSRSTWAIKWVSNWISRETLWFCSWNSYPNGGGARYVSGWMKNYLQMSSYLRYMHCKKNILMRGFFPTGPDRGVSTTRCEKKNIKWTEPCFLRDLETFSLPFVSTDSSPTVFIFLLAHLDNKFLR